MEILRDMPTLLRHFFTELFSLSGLVWMFRLRALILFVALIIYFISPLDILSEAVFGIIGLLDDFAILLLVPIYYTVMYRQLVAARDNQFGT